MDNALRKTGLLLFLFQGIHPPLGGFFLSTYSLLSLLLEVMIAYKRVRLYQAGSSLTVHERFGRSQPASLHRLQIRPWPFADHSVINRLAKSSLARDCGSLRRPETVHVPYTLISREAKLQGLLIRRGTQGPWGPRFRRTCRVFRRTPAPRPGGWWAAMREGATGCRSRPRSPAAARRCSPPRPLRCARVRACVSRYGPPRSALGRSSLARQREKRRTYVVDVSEQGARFPQASFRTVMGARQL